MSDIRIEKRETLLSTPRVRTERVTLSLPPAEGAGADRERLERIVHDHGDAACVLAYDPARKTVLLTRQARYPVFVTGAEAELVEPCAGLIDPGESAEEAIRREAMEEIGTRLGALEKIGEVYTSPGFLTEKISLFLAEYTPDDRIAAGGGLAEENEHIEVLEWPCERLSRALVLGEIRDAKLMILTQALMRLRPALF